MAHDPKRIAIESLFLTMQDKLPAILVARDAARFAVRRCPLGPYTFTTGTVLTVNGESFTLTENLSGPNTAAFVAAQITGISFTCSAETDGSDSRLVFTANTAPTRETPSVLRFEGGDAAMTAFGLRAGGPSDAVEEALSDPLPLYSEGEPGDVVMVDRPLVFCSEVVSAQYSKGLVRQRMQTVEVTLEVWIPGSMNLPPHATLNKAFEFERALAVMLRTGDSRAGFFVGGSTVGARIVQAKLRDLAVRTQVLQFRDGGATIPVAVCRPVVEFLVSSTDA